MSEGLPSAAQRVGTQIKRTPTPQARRRDAKLVKIRKRADGTKFKIRCSK